MASDESPKATCPVCDQTDHVKTMQAAYSLGVSRCAPPDMPTRNISMSKYIIACATIIGICLFLIIVLIGGMENNFPKVYQFVLVLVTLISIIGALVVSYVAFQRIVRGDDEAALLYPAWDKATETWKGLAYCARDNVVFDPKTGAVLTDEQLTKIRTSATHQIQKEVTQQQRSAAVQH